LKLWLRLLSYVNTEFARALASAQYEDHYREEVDKQKKAKQSALKHSLKCGEYCEVQRTVEFNGIPQELTFTVHIDRAVELDVNRQIAERRESADRHFRYAVERAVAKELEEHYRARSKASK
jgi:hypothetical protein